MPSISTFYGIVIMMFWDDHNPPHFHARYSGMNAVFDIETLDLLRGNLSPRAAHLVREWAEDHRAELREDWRRGQNGDPFLPIAPLE